MTSSWDLLTCRQAKPLKKGFESKRKLEVKRQSDEKIITFWNFIEDTEGDFTIRTLKEGLKAAKPDKPLKQHADVLRKGAEGTLSAMLAKLPRTLVKEADFRRVIKLREPPYGTKGIDPQLGVL